MGIPKLNGLTTGESIVRFNGIEVRPDGLEQERVPERNAVIDQDEAPLDESITTQDNFPKTNFAGGGETEANIVRPMTSAQCRLHAQSMQPEQLAEHVVRNGWGEVLVGLTKLKPYLEILWDRFDELRGTETISGCRTKTEFSELCLHRSIRAVQYMLYGRPPKKANSARSGKQPKVEVEELVFDSDNDVTPPAEAVDAATAEEQSVPGPAKGPNHVSDEEAHLARRVTARATMTKATRKKLSEASRTRHCRSPRTTECLTLTPAQWKNSDRGSA